jgi:hypothetical protein
MSRRYYLTASLRPSTPADNHILPGEFLVAVDVDAEGKLRFPDGVAVEDDGSGTLTATKTLIHADILALPDQGTVELFPAIADQWYDLVGGYVVSHIVAPYTNLDAIREFTIGYDDDNVDVADPEGNYAHGWAGLTQSRVAPLVPLIVPDNTANLVQEFALSEVLGKNLALYFDNDGHGSPDGGHPENYIKFVLRYIAGTP